jgi:hypothetical protein
VYIKGFGFIKEPRFHLQTAMTADSQRYVGDRVLLQLFSRYFIATKRKRRTDTGNTRARTDGAAAGR